MKQTKFSETQIVAILGSVGKDKNVENVCREHGISPATFYNWKSKYGGMGTDELKRMRELESENARLKKLLADKSLDYDILKEGRSAAAVRVTKKAISSTTHQQAVNQISTKKEVSVRRCCRVLGQRKASIYYKHKRKNEDAQIAAMLKGKAIEQPNWVFRLLFHWCRNQGKLWNKKRVYRIYKAEKLNLRSPKARKKIKRVAINPLPAEQINQGWSMDFLSDVLLSDERKVRVLNVLDECSRKVLLSFAATSIKARKLVKLLQELITQKGKPAYIRCDNGPEFISRVLEKFAQENGIEIRFSQPGKPTQNGLVERLNGTQRKECLNLKYFKTVQEVQRDLDIWWNSYNFDRPHLALGYLTPQQFIDKNQNLYFNLVAA